MPTTYRVIRNLDRAAIRGATIEARRRVASYIL